MTADAPLERILDKRLVFVAGKGGVGRTTVAAALGLAAAERGLRTIVASVGGRDELPTLFALEAPADPGTPGTPDDPDAPRGPRGPRAHGPRATGAHGEHRLAAGLFSIVIDPDRAMAEYLRDQLPVAALGDLLSASRAFGYLAAATPGLRELLTVGKIWELAQPERRAAGARAYDLVVVDGPATGYGVSLLAAPGTFSRVAHRGPIARHAGTIHATLTDPRLTGVIGVTTAEESAVAEVVATRARLREELGIELGVVIANAVRGRRFAARDRGALRAVTGVATGTGASGGLSAGARWAVELALEEDERTREERRQLARVAAVLGEAPVELPFIGTGELGRQALGELARALGGSG
jgi:anion-transporting ATPase